MRVIGFLTLVFAASMCLGVGPALAEESGTSLASLAVPPGHVFFADEASPYFAIKGSLDGEADHIDIAIKNVDDGTWWTPAEPCSNEFTIPCPDGGFEPRWSTATIPEYRPGTTFYMGFLAEVGNYMVGIKVYDDEGQVTDRVWHDFSIEPLSPLSVWSDIRDGDELNEGIVPISGGIEGPDGRVGPHEQTVMVGVYSRTLRSWVDPQGNPLPAFQEFEAPIHVAGGVVFFGNTYSLDFILPPGSYAFGVNAIDHDTGQIGSTPWTGFTVAECSHSCANGLYIEGPTAPFVRESDNVCFSFDTNAIVKMAVRNDDTNEWLQGDPLALAPGWAQYNNASSRMQAGGGHYNTCFHHAPLNLPPGNYHLGLKAYTREGEQGPKIWVAFTVVE